VRDSLKRSELAGHWHSGDLRAMAGDLPLPGSSTTCIAMSKIAANWQENPLAGSQP
jgi:hypothetical protein